MKFKFCGDRDAPDWLLAEMFTISKLSSVRVKLLCATLAERVRARELASAACELTDFHSDVRPLPDVDYAKFQKLVDGAVTSPDVEGVIAALEYTLASAARYDVDEGALQRELEQLGLPKEHADAVCKPYGKTREDLRAALARGTAKVNALRALTWGVTFTSEPGGETLGVRLKLDTVEDGVMDLEVSEEKFRVLLGELKTVKALMDAECPPT